MTTEEMDMSATRRAINVLCLRARGGIDALWDVSNVMRALHRVICALQLSW